MVSGEDKKSKDYSIKKNHEEDVVKQRILDENYKKAEVALGLRKKEKTVAVHRRKTFFHLGVFLIIAAVICLIIIEHVPWFYVKCEVNDDGNTAVLKASYYKDFVNNDKKNYSQIEELFKPVDGIYPLGLSIDDFLVTSTLSYYSFLILVLIGLIFTVFAVLYRFSKFSYETIVIIQSITSLLSVVVCVFLIVIFIRFVAAYILLYYNISIINRIVSNASVSFPVPILMIIILSFVLKICFTMVRTGYRELERKMKYTSSMKGTGFTYRV